MATVMVFREQDLPKLPKEVRRYVDEWFRKQDVLGVPCLVAFGKLTCAWNDYSQRGRKPGWAPTHSVDVREYDPSPGKSLGEWMRENAGKLVWVLYGRDETEGNVIDCD